MEMNTRTILTILAVVAGIAIIFYFVYTKFLKPTQQAVQAPVQVPVQPAPSTTPPPPGLLPFTVQSGSYLAQFAGLPVTVNPNIPGLQIGDSYWVALQAPNGVLVLMPMSIVTAQAKLAAGLLMPGKSYTIQVVPVAQSEGVEFKQQSSTYASYGTETVTLTAGMLRDIMRGNKSLFAQLYNYLQLNNTPGIQTLINSLANNPQLQQIVKTIAASPNNLPAPLAISYNVGITLGIVPPQIQSYITNPNNVVIDFGYV